MLVRLHRLLAAIPNKTRIVDVVNGSMMDSTDMRGDGEGKPPAMLYGRGTLRAVSLPNPVQGVTE